MNRVVPVPDDSGWLRGSIWTDEGTVPAYTAMVPSGSAQSVVDIAWVEPRTRLATREFSIILFNDRAALEFATIEPKEYPSIENPVVVFSSVSSIGQASEYYQGVNLNVGDLSDYWLLMVFPLRKRNVKVDFAVKFSGVG